MIYKFGVKSELNEDGTLKFLGISPRANYSGIEVSEIDWYFAISHLEKILVFYQDYEKVELLIYNFIKELFEYLKSGVTPIYESDQNFLVYGSPEWETYVETSRTAYIEKKLKEISEKTQGLVVIRSGL
jgi:hypothetical protein